MEGGGEEVGGVGGGMGRLHLRGVTAASAVSSLKTSVTTSPTQVSVNSTQDQVEETASQDSNADIAPRTPSSKGMAIPSASSTPVGTQAAATTSNIPARTLAGGSTASPILTCTGSLRGGLDNAAAVVPSSPISIASTVKEEENTSFPGRQSSPVLAEIGLGMGRGSAVGVATSQSSNGGPLSSASVIPSPSGALGAAPAASDMTKRNILGADEKTGSGGIVQPLASPLSSRMLVSQSIDGTGSADSNSIGEATILGGRVFSPSGVPGVQWRPHSASSFQNPNEAGQFRGRTEIAPDQREKFLQRLQQVQQQGHSNILGMSHFTGGKQFSAQQQTSLQQQFNSQSSSLSSQGGLGLGVTSASLQQPNSVLQQSGHHGLMSTGPNDSDVGHAKFEDQQQQQNPSEDSNMEFTLRSMLSKNLMKEDDSKASYAAGGSGSLTEASRISRDVDLSPGQPLQSNQPSVSLGVIGRRSVSDLGAIGDNLSGSTANSGGTHDQYHNLQMLEAAYYKLPQPKDSERAKTYIPRHPVATPQSYPQVQAPIVDNPAFWERLDVDTLGTDMLFFAFYHQQNTYQQYLAAKELKKQSWRYHRKYNTWFQRHEEPKVATDEYEQGTYVYFDFHIANDDLQHGWCQRIKTEFTFEYSYLEDELAV